MSHDADVVYLADHSLLLAIPAVIPALLIVAVVLFVVVRDRRAEKRENGADPDIERNDS